MKEKALFKNAKTLLFNNIEERNPTPQQSRSRKYFEVTFNSNALQREKGKFLIFAQLLVVAISQNGTSQNEKNELSSKNDTSRDS